MEIKQMKDISLESHKIDVLVYGKAGTGKTVLGATFPKPIYIDTESGLLSVRKKDISFLTCKRNENKLAWWQEIKKATALALSSTEHESIIIDSFSGVFDAMLGAVEFDASIRTKGGEIDGYKKWGLLWEWTLNYISLVRGSSKNVLFICGESFDQDDSGRAFFHPSLVGKAKSNIAHYFDEFYHSEVKNEEYKLLIRPRGLYTAKSRVLDKGDKTTHINPHYQDIKTLLVK